MARPIRPWYSTEKRCWMIQFKGKRIRLVDGPHDDATRDQAEGIMRAMLLKKLERMLKPPKDDAEDDEPLPRATAPLSRFTVPETVHGLIDWYLANELKPPCAKAKLERNRQLAMFADYCGHMPIKDCNAAMLLTFIMHQPKAKSGWTQRRLKGTICRPFNYAVKMGLLAVNPFRGCAFPVGKYGRDWSDAEFQAALRVSPAHFRRVIVFLRFSGARQGELRNLRWSQIDREAKVIVQHEHKTAHHGHGPRRIYFNHVIAKLLLWIRRQEIPGDFVFVNSFRRPWVTKALTKQMDNARNEADLPADVKLHGCRHFFATRAIMNGVDVLTLAQLLGHGQVLTTQRYVHLVNRHQHLNDAMDKAIGGSKPADGK